MHSSHISGGTNLISTPRTEAPWRVGILFSRSGPLAVIGETQLRGTLMAIDEINAHGGVNGRPIEPVIYDPGSEAGSFGQYAKRLMIEDSVTAIFGCYTSSSRKAVLPVVERLNGLLWYPTVYEGFECSPNVIYSGASPNQNCIRLCSFLMQHYGPRFYCVGSDYVYPRVTNRIVRDFVLANGGEIVGEEYLGLSARHMDYVPIMRDIRNASPDVIFSTVVGSSTAQLYQSYADFGFDPKVTPIASLTTTEAEILDMGLDVGENHISAASYFDGLENDYSSSFSRRYKKLYGADEATNACIETSYVQVKMFAQALENTNTMHTDVIRANMLGAVYEAPQGPISIDLFSGHANLWTRVGRANRQGMFDVLYASNAPVTADPYLVTCGVNKGVG